MEKEFLIAWKNNSNGRMGRSNNLLDKHEAETLAEQLNKEHPEFEHVVIHKDTQSTVRLFSHKPEDERVLETSLVGSGPVAPSEPESGFTFPQEEVMWGQDEGDSGGNEQSDDPEQGVA